MLIDKDSKPKDTVLYLSARLLHEIKQRGEIQLASLEQLYNEIDGAQPLFKFVLALDFLYLIDKVKIEGRALFYVP